MKVALITGGAKGIGRALTQAFSKENYTVYFVDHDAGAGKELAQSIPNSHFIPCDIENPEHIKKAVEQITQIDVLINNAGISIIEDMLSDDAVAAFEKVINVNLRGTFLFSHYAAKKMQDAAIINMASTRWLQSEANTEGYSASKGGIVALTHAMAISLAPKRIRVNAISPGWIDVQHHQSSNASVEIAPHASLSPISEQDREQHPVGRVGVPEDIASMALFLADSNKSGFITGQNFVVDGGMTKKMIYVY
jgi:NAD(P)-dependent dehydrogenase (short-subunit alcohol dehydrogenase family)